MTPPDVTDGRLAHLLRLRHQPATPMRHAFGFGLQRGIDDGLNLFRSIGGHHYTQITPKMAILPVSY